MMRGVYDLLPTPSNLAKWFQEESDLCRACKGFGTLQHILSACPNGLSMYKWRHDQVLRVAGAVVEEAVRKANKDQQRVMPTRITFVPAGATFKPPPQIKNPHGHSLLSGTQDWKCQVDLDRALQFPPEIALTRLRPDVVITSRATRVVIMGELTVPWEDNVQEAYERKN